MTRSLSEALRWLTSLLTDLELSYQIVGGLAATCYGSTRPLVDVDLYVPDQADLARLAEAAEAYLVRPPRRHRDEHWDLTFLKLTWGGFLIEAAGARGARVWDRRVEGWRDAGIRFDHSEEHEVAGVPLPIMPLAQLADYKRGLGRPVDLVDLEEMGTG